MNDPIRQKLTRRMALAAGAVAVSGAWAISSLTGGGARSAPAALNATILNRGNGAEPDSLDPNKIQGNWENNIVCDMFLGLMTEDAAAKPIPGAAESWTVSPDGLVYTFKIRDHLWSDGVPVTAHDFVYSFRRIANPKTAAQYAPILYPIRNMQEAAEGRLPPDSIGVRELDPRTFEMRFIFQVPYLMELLMHETAMPVPAHVVERHGDDWTKPANIACNGPYVLKEWVPNDHIRLVRNPHFHARETVAIESVVYYPTPDSSAAIKRFRSGELDLLTDTLPPQQVDWLRRTMPHDVRLSPYLLTEFVQFNLREKPFDDIRVRRALSLGIDREVVCAKVLRAGEAPAYSFVPSVLPGYPGTAQLRFKTLQTRERQVEARYLLSQAGFGPGNPLTFDFSVMNTTESKIIALALQEMWRQIGARVRIAASDSQMHYSALRKRDFSVAWEGWVADYRDPKDYLFLLQSSTTDMNYGSYSNPAFDALMVQSDTTQDPKSRFELLAQAEQIMLDDVAIAPVLFGVTRNLVSPQVKGWIDNSINFHRTRWLSLDRSVAVV